MIKSISQWAFKGEQPLKEVFRMARENGFAAVEVAVAQSGELTPHSSAEECVSIVEQAREAGVQLASLASGLGWQFPLTTADEALRREAISLTAGSLRVAQRLGVDALLCVPGVVADGADGTPYDVAYENALAAARELAPVAEECGVTLGIENVWNKFLLSPLEMRNFLDAVESPRVGSYFDAGNVIFAGYPEQWIRILGKRITRVHLKDFKRSVGTLDGFCDLLDGDVDYRAVMDALREIGYNSFATAEFFNCEADLAKISRAMDKIFEM